MSRKLFISSLFAISPMVFAAPGDFDKEVTVSVADSDNVDAYGINGNYFFDMVDTSRGPLAEARFLDRTTNIGLAYSRSEFDAANLMSIDTDSFALNGTYAFGDQNLYITGSIVRIDNDFGDATGYALGIGHYLDDDWEVTANMSFDDEEELQTFAFGTRKLFDLGGDRYFALGGDVSLNNEADDSFGINSAYYFNRNTSIDLGYGWASEDIGDGLANLGVTWFYSPTISIRANTAIGFGDNDIDFGDSFSLVAQARF